MNKRGFTLLEAMIGIAILGIIMMASYGILQTGNTVYTRDTNLVEMQQQTRNGMARMVRDLRQASSQTITTISSDIDRISINTPTLTGLQYYLNGTTLVRQAPNGTTANIASNINKLKFTLNGTLLTIQLQASKTSYTNQVTTFPLTGQVRLRNE